MVNVPKLFGSLTFNERVMKDRLPAKTFRTFRKMVEEGLPLTRALADMMAYAMKDWALENGCTHFTHWFQPMTGITAEKHDSFIAPAADGRVIMDGSYELCVYQRRLFVYSYRVLFLHRGCAGQEDPAFAFHSHIKRSGQTVAGYSRNTY